MLSHFKEIKKMTNYKITINNVEYRNRKPMGWDEAIERATILENRNMRKKYVVQELLDFEAETGLKIEHVSILVRIDSGLIDAKGCLRRARIEFNGPREGAFKAFKNIYYDSGYGAQELFGYLWFNDGSWADRYEYDGSEYWVLRKRPKKDVLMSGDQ